VDTSLPIGVFDSGVGGLTVLRALRCRLPREPFLYLGDTARLPYGTKSPRTVARYARQAARILVERGVKLLVVACNTASAVALDELRRHFAPLPLVGVVEPGADAACNASEEGRIIVIGSESTIRGRAYERAIHRRRPDGVVIARACPLFVALAEEGWTGGPIPESVAHHYLDDLLAGPGGRPDTILLGCTHFPVLAPVIAKVVGESVVVVDSAETTAAAVEEALRGRGLLGGSAAGAKSVTFLATDAPERFARVGAVFLGGQIDEDRVELVDLQA
jgi:glutamate racemase